METKLERIAKIAKEKPNEKFTSLIHLLNKEMILECHKEMKTGKAAGIDEITKTEYDKNLEKNVENLVERMKKQAYKPQAVKRVYIPKPGTEDKRPLGIPSYEDKLVQLGLSKILNAIYEQDFLDCSFGFRPKRSCHDALKVLNRIINKEEITTIVDIDIKGFFDHVSHEWMLKFLTHRITDPNVHRLITRFLKSGIIEDGIRHDTTQGTPQGGVISPILANIYLHYVVDLWFEKRIRKQNKGQAYMVRYADDIVFCFQYEEEAKEFYKLLENRLKEFELELSREKSKIISIKDDKDKDDDDDKNEGNKHSFDFLGFTHYKSTDKYGRALMKCKTSKKKYRASLLRVKEWIKSSRTIPIKDFMKKINIKLTGYVNYYGVSYNYNSVNNFIDEVRTLIYKWLNRRSQKRSFDWSKFILFMRKYPLTKPKTKVNLFVVGAGISYC